MKKKEAFEKELLRGLIISFCICGLIPLFHFFLDNRTYFRDTSKYADVHIEKAHVTSIDNIRARTFFVRKYLSTVYLLEPEGSTIHKSFSKKYREKEGDIIDVVVADGRIIKRTELIYSDATHKSLKRIIILVTASVTIALVKELSFFKKK